MIPEEDEFRDKVRMGKKERMGILKKKCTGERDERVEFLGEEEELEGEHFTDGFQRHANRASQCFAHIRERDLSVCCIGVLHIGAPIGVVVSDSVVVWK